MDAGEPSQTAMIVAGARESHRSEDLPPWILDDPYALVLLGPAWIELRARSKARVREPLRRRTRASLVVRSRYAEDRLLNGEFEQYVILGAGLDSFAWRRPDLVGPLRVFEIDHPSTQAWKRSRIESLALPVADDHVFVPIDFETETLQSGLEAAGFDWSRPTLFSWLGVTMYLTTEAIEVTLRTVATCAPRSEIVFSYSVSDAFLDDLGREWQDLATAMVAEVGEPFANLFSPTDAEALVRQCGLHVAEHPTREVLRDRYFSGRTDGLEPGTPERVLAAQVPAG